MQISNELLQKYNIPVPRYTSYPPANHFTSKFDDRSYLNLLVDSNNRKPEHLAFYFHIPFCKKICYYCGCNAYTSKNEEQVERYFQALKQEIELVTSHISSNRKIAQIHFGGGTPNAVEAARLKELIAILQSKFATIEKPEIAIECNPAYLTFEYIDLLKEAGINRFSLGIQDFDNEILKSVNRDSSKIPVKELVEYLKKGRNDISVNLDFIYGLPGQTIESFNRTIEQAIAIRPDRLVTFSYAHVPWMKKHQSILEKRGLPSSDIKMKMFLSAYDQLIAAGYKAIGLDHFVLPSDELQLALESQELHRNFQGYCTRRTTGQVYAFGVTAISQLENGYAQNVKDIEEYISLIGSQKLPTERGYQLSPTEIIIREAINEIMCNKQVSWEHIAHRLGTTSEEVLNALAISSSTLEDLQNNDLIRFNEEGITVTEIGTIFIRNIAAALDKHYQQQNHSYSKTV